MKSLKSISKWFKFYCFYAFRMSNKATLDKFHEFGSRSIGDMVDIIYVIKPLLFWKNYPLYSINRAYYISNTPWTKVMKLVLNSFILHSKCIDTIKFVPFWNWLEPFLEYLQKIHVKKTFLAKVTDYLCITPFTKTQKDKFVLNFHLLKNW